MRSSRLFKFCCCSFTPCLRFGLLARGAERATAGVILLAKLLGELLLPSVEVAGLRGAFPSCRRKTDWRTCWRNSSRSSLNCRPARVPSVTACESCPWLSTSKPARHASGSPPFSRGQLVPAADWPTARFERSSRRYRGGSPAADRGAALTHASALRVPLQTGPFPAPIAVSRKRSLRSSCRRASSRSLLRTSRDCCWACSSSGARRGFAFRSGFRPPTALTGRVGVASGCRGWHFGHVLPITADDLELAGPQFEQVLIGGLLFGERWPQRRDIGFLLGRCQMA